MNLGALIQNGGQTAAAEIALLLGLLLGVLYLVGSALEMRRSRFDR